ncbi:putative Prolamin-like domain-containing protein [Arabidopsis thaliana]
MAIKNVILFLAVLCIALSVNAQLPQFPALFPFPFPFLPSPGVPGLPDITKCLSSVINIPGCIVEFSQSILLRKFGKIGSACCKAILEAETNCIPQLPFNLFFPPMLKEQYSKTVGGSSYQKLELRNQ